MRSVRVGSSGTSTPCVRPLPNYGPGLQMLIVAAAEAGRMEEAGMALRQLLSLGPYKTARGISDTWFFRDPLVVERFRAAIDSVGLAE